MLKERARPLSVGMLSLELLLWTAAFFVAQWIRAWLPAWFEQAEPLRAGPPNVWLLEIALTAWMAASSALGLRRSYRTRSIAHEQTASPEGLWTTGAAVDTVAFGLPRGGLGGPATATLR